LYRIPSVNRSRPANTRRALRAHLFSLRAQSERRTADADSRTDALRSEPMRRPKPVSPRMATMFARSSCKVPASASRHPAAAAASATKSHMTRTGRSR